MRPIAAAICGALVAVTLAACQYPRDPGDTLERVRGGTLRVGVTESDPFVVVEGGRPRGVEVRLLELLAGELGARIEWIEGSEGELMGALKERQLDVVVGGLTSEAPWQKEAALTRPYLTTRTVVGVPRDQAVPDDLEGVRVSVERGSEEAGLLDRTTAAVPVPVADIAAAGGPAAVPAHGDPVPLPDPGQLPGDEGGLG